MHAESQIEAVTPTATPTATESPSPFARPLADERIFETGATTRTLSELRQALQDGSDVILLEGEHGSGKSTLLRLLLAGAAEAFVSCLVEARMTLGERHVLGYIAAVFGCRPLEQPAALAPALLRQAGHGRSLLIAVDNADRLSPFALRALLTLQRGIAQHGGRLCLVLSCRPRALEVTLALPAFAAWSDEDHFLRIAMPVFSEQETADYLRYRIESAGLADRIAFDAGQARRLHKAARGLPRHIDRLADDLLHGRPLQPWRGPRERRRARRHRQWLGGALAAGMVVAGVVWGITRDGSPTRPMTFEQAMQERSPAIAAVRPEAVAIAPPAPVEAPPAPAPAPVPAPVPERASTASAPAVAEPLTGRDWLMAQDPDRYTVQLASTPDHAGALAFIERHGLDDSTAIATTRGGRTLYLVIHGSFPDVTEARLAAATLPQALRRNDPFARSIRSLREIAQP